MSTKIYKFFKKIKYIGNFFNNFKLFNKMISICYNKNMESNLIIRFSEAKDLKNLPWLFRQYYNGDNGIETDYNKMINKFQELSENKDYKFVSAIYSNKVVGFCSVVVNQDILDKQRPLVFLWHLRVAPKFRNKGIGKAIMDFVEEFAKSINADYTLLSCDTNNENACKFYDNLGYSRAVSFYKYM